MGAKQIGTEKQTHICASLRKHWIPGLPKASDTQRQTPAIVLSSLQMELQTTMSPGA